MSEKGKDQRIVLGKLGEKLAGDYLSSQSYQIVGLNWRCRSGEIDIIALDGEVLVFVEVRTRRQTGTYGSPQESVDSRKQKQIKATAQVFLHQHHKHECKVRFDMIAVQMDMQGDLLHINHLIHAF